jgi:hypothetical protein
MSNIEVLAQRISGNDGVKAIYLLGRMEQEGLVKKNGIDKVMAFFTDVYKTAGDRGNAQLIYIVAATLIDYGVFSDYGMDEVKSKLTKFSSELGPRGFMLLVFIDKLIKDGTVKKLGLEKTCSFVIDCFRSAKYGETKQANLDAIIDGLAFGLGQLAEKGLILKLGVDELLKVSRAAGKGTEAAFVGLYNLEDAGTLKKFGIENLLEIANAAKQKSGEAYDALIALDNKGLIEKIGVSNLVQIAKEAGENSAAKLKELIPEEDRKRPDIFPE